MPVRNTNVELKLEKFNEWCRCIQDQFVYGGKKYAAINPDMPDKESTDYICDVFPEFVEATMMKYLLRFKTQKREEDLFKIATYCYILWLKYFTGDVREANLAISQEARSAK